MKISKPWGSEQLLFKTPKYAAKYLDIKNGCRLSLQYHKEKMESIRVLSGILTITEGDHANELYTSKLKPGGMAHFAPGRIHRFAALHGPVHLLEVSTPELDDVVRIEDDWGRTSKVTWEDR